jgi:hypothetical protein
MASDTFILLAVSAGVMEEKGKDPMPYASVEVANCRAKDTGRDGRVTYGSPVLKLKLIDESTGKPNIQLARALVAADAYGKPVTFHGVYELAKVKGVEQMTFTILDADLATVKSVKVA